RGRKGCQNSDNLNSGDEIDEQMWPCHHCGGEHPVGDNPCHDAGLENLKKKSSIDDVKTPERDADDPDDLIPITEIMKPAKASQKKPQPVSKTTRVVEPIRTKTELGKIADLSHDTIHRIAVIEAKADDETKVKLARDELSINQVYTQLKRQEKEEKREE